VLFGSNGVLYSTAAGSNITVDGGAVALTPPVKSGGAWEEATIVTFGTPYAAGWEPYAGLVADGGRMYGTNNQGGVDVCGVAPGCGAVYELIPPSAPGGGWAAEPVYDFTGSPGDGGFPVAPVVVGNSGVLYGTTLYGGSAVASCSSFASGCGTVFRLTPPPAPGGTWTESILYSFTGANGDGADPLSAVVVGPNGQLYGTTEYGGDISVSSACPASYNYPAGGCGTVFELRPPTTVGGLWSERVLHAFTGLDGDGAYPTAGLVTSPSGVLYGTTSSGGAGGRGTVFAIKP